MAKKKEVYQTGRKPELRIQGVSEKTKQEIINIADNVGVGISELLRPKLREIIESYPEKFRQPKPDY